MFARAQQLSDAKDQLSAFSRRNVAPGFERGGRGLDGFVGQFFGGFVKRADHLGAIRGIDAVERVTRIDALAAYDERILAAEFALYLVERGAHRLGVFFFGEISKWFVAKFSWHDFVGAHASGMLVQILIREPAGGVLTIR